MKTRAAQLEAENKMFNVTLEKAKKSNTELRFLTQKYQINAEKYKYTLVDMVASGIGGVIGTGEVVKLLHDRLLGTDGKMRKLSI